MRGRNASRRAIPQQPLGFPEITNPGVAAEIENATLPAHPFEGDDHGHDRHDTIPAEEEWLDDELRWDDAHNPKRGAQGGR